MKTLTNVKPLTIITSVFLISVFVFISWIEVKQTKEQLAPKSDFLIASEYYLNASSKPEQVPDDSLPLNIYIGEFKATNKSLTFIDNGLKPTTFAQRVVNLRFKLDNIPEDTMPLRKKISEIVHTWGLKGNAITALFVDYSPKKPDFAKYNKFLYDLKRISDDFKYQTVQYHVVPLISKSWINNKDYKNYINLKENASLFSVSLTKEELTSPEALKKLNDIGFSFKLILPDGYKNLAFDPKLIKQNRYFGNAMETIDAGFIKPDNEIKVGFLPKFIEKFLR